MDEKKVAAVVERWRKSGFGITLHDSEYTPEEQVEIFRRCEEIAKSSSQRRQAESRTYRPN